MTNLNRVGRLPKGEEVPDRSTPPVLAYPDRACKGVGAALFFPEKGDRVSGAKAKELCNRCPHKEECLRWALDTKQGFGIYGGASPNARRQMLRKEREVG